MKLLNRCLLNVMIAGGVLSSSFAAQDVPGMSIPKVDVYVVGDAKDTPILLEYPARITSVKNVTMIARVSGILEEKHYTEGLHVKKGTLLYKIEPAIYRASADSAKATLALEISKFEKAKKDWERADGLYKDKAISEQDKDTAFFAYQTAKASVDVAKAELQKVLVNLNYTDVNATISGMAGIKMVDVGDFVKEGTPLVTITQTNPINAVFSIPDINSIKQKYELQKGNWSNIQGANLKASLIVDNKPYKNIGTINFIDSHIDDSTSTLKARAVFNNASSELLAGEFVKIRVIGVVSKNVISVPQKAVLQNPLGTVVFVIVDGKVTVKPVKIIDSTGQNFVVQGVKAKDVVIVNNFFRIKPGSAVVIDKTVNKQAE